MEHDIVLIETLWNVKETDPDGFMSIPDGINRNIVECKVMRCVVDTMTITAY